MPDKPPQDIQFAVLATEYDTEKVTQLDWNINALIGNQQGGQWMDHWLVVLADEINNLVDKDGNVITEPPSVSKDSS